MNASNPRYDHLFRKAQDAERGGHDAWAVQSTGEKAAVALVLNRADWLAEHGYTIAEAIERMGPEWVAIIPQVARQLAEEEQGNAHDSRPSLLSVLWNDRRYCARSAPR